MPRNVARGWPVVLAGLALAAAGSAAAQEPTVSGAADAPYDVPRTPHGHPDLEGFWSNQTYTPLERREGWV